MRCRQSLCVRSFEGAFVCPDAECTQFIRWSVTVPFAPSSSAYALTSTAMCLGAVSVQSALLQCTARMRRSQMVRRSLLQTATETNAMLSACAAHGDAQRATELFVAMRTEHGVAVDLLSFAMLLSAYGHRDRRRHSIARNKGRRRRSLRLCGRSFGGRYVVKRRVGDFCECEAVFRALSL